MICNKQKFNHQTNGEHNNRSQDFLKIKLPSHIIPRIICNIKPAMDSIMILSHTKKDVPTQGTQTLFFNITHKKGKCSIQMSEMIVTLITLKKKKKICDELGKLIYLMKNWKNLLIDSTCDVCRSQKAMVSADQFMHPNRRKSFS